MRLNFLSASLAVALGCAVSSAGPIGLVDAFDGGLGAYTATRILKATPAASDNVGQWEIDSGALQYNTATFGGIEQYALTRTDVTLEIGEELQVDYLGASLGGNLGSQDIGLYVGAGHPASGVRANFVNVYVRNNGQLFSRGFNGTTEFALGGGSTPTDLETLFIKRLTVDTFELGFYTSNSPVDVRNVVSTRTIASGNAAGVGSAIGLYADVRAAGIRGDVDNLRIIPEPTAAALVALMSACVCVRRRR